MDERKGRAAWCCISLFQSYLHCSSISPSVCKDFEWNPQMSQIGLSQLCRGLALSAVMVQGYWNCFVLASPSWNETTHNLNCRKKKRLKILLVPSAMCTVLPLFMAGPSPPHSPHPILSLTLYISSILSLISCSITFYTSSSLPPLCFHLKVFLNYPISPHQPRVASRAQMSQRKHDTNRVGSASLWPWLHEYVCCGWTKGSDIF